MLACNDYLRMGIRRTLPSLRAQYATAAYQGIPPTTSLQTLKEWSALYGWQERADEYDAEVERERNARIEAERRAVMEQGIAVDYIRMQKLQRLADFLEEQLYATEPRRKSLQALMAEAAARQDREQREWQAEAARRAREEEIAEVEMRDGARPPWLIANPPEPLMVGDDEPVGEVGPAEDEGEGEGEEDLGVRYKNVWLADVKGVGGVPYDIERFNAPIIEQFRATLDDAAKEKGERRLRVESASIAVQLTAEDLAQAQAALQAWEHSRFGSSQSASTAGGEDEGEGEG